MDGTPNTGMVNGMACCGPNFHFLEQDLNEAGLAAVPWTRQRAQARRHAGGERCAGRRDNTHRESRCVEFVIDRSQD